MIKKMFKSATQSKVVSQLDFFEENINCVTVDSTRYCEMLLNILTPKLSNLPDKDVWFQQDGATAHTAYKYKAILVGLSPY